MADVHAAVVRVDLRIPEARSLKARRSVLTPIVEGARRRHRVAVSEIEPTGDRWHRATLAFATVSGSAAVAQNTLAEVERFVWSFPEIEVLHTSWSWLDEPE